MAGTPTPALLAYPDPLAALTAFGAVIRALAGDGGVEVGVSLAGAMAPLLPTAGRPLGEPDRDTRLVDWRRRAPRCCANAEDWRAVRSSPAQLRSSASATRSIGWRTVTPAAARCIAQPGLALATTVAPDRAAARSIAATLRARTSTRQRRLQRRVGATGTAAQALVVELDDVGDLAEHGPHRLVAPLHVTQVAGVLDDHRAEWRATGGQAIRRPASHSWTSTTRDANVGRPGSRAGGRSP